MLAFWIGVLGNIVASALITAPTLAWHLRRRHRQLHERLVDAVRAELRGTDQQPAPRT